MGTFSIWHWLILIMVVALLFGGRGKISGLMGDLAQGSAISARAEGPERRARHCRQAGGRSQEGR
jgi:TatA/E family protein of Tat protein translocase